MRRIPLTVALCLLVIPLWSASRTAAQRREGFRLDRFQAAPSAEDGLGLQLPRTLGHLRPSLGLVLDYAHAPLVVEDSAGERVGAIVEHQLTTHVVGALGVGERYEVHLRLPLTLFQSGEGPSIGGRPFPEPAAAALADTAFGGSMRLLGDSDLGAQLGLTAWLTVPIGNAKAYSGDKGVGAEAEVLAAYVTERVTVASTLGAYLRPDRDFEDQRLGPELSFGLGAYVAPTDGLLLALELDSATGLREGQAFQPEGTPIETRLGVRYVLPVGLALTAAVGAGLSQAVGVPDVRALAGVAFAPVQPVAAETLPPPPTDLDGDGIMDGEDACPGEAEDPDGFEDTDGCPDNDNDNDWVMDVDDQCPTEPEDPDNIEDTDGCPEFDEDGDGLDDGDDGCPNEPEDQDGFEDEDGCPDTDDDGDGVPDVDDRCKNVPGVAENAGCPAAARIENQQIRILQRIEFEVDGAVLQPSALPVLEDVRAVLAAVEWIRKVRVEGHTDNNGRANYNRQLSQRRADTVVRWLIDHGIEAERLEAVGVGEDRPIASNRRRAGREANRRVEFHIVDPAQAPEPPGSGVTPASEPTPAGESPSDAQPPADDGSQPGP